MGAPAHTNCRFCDAPLMAGATSPLCDSPDCQELAKTACTHVCDCGHLCCGIKDETVHYGCGRCSGSRCICGEPTTTEPTLLLACGHSIHLNCARCQFGVASDRGKIIQPRCGFPGCRALPEHRVLEEQFGRWSGIRSQIEVLMQQIIVDEALDKEPDHVLNPASEYYGNPTSFARDRLAFYMCGRCKSPYYGGHERCAEPDAPKQPDDAYLCKPCSARCFCTQTCAKHGETGMIFKCFWCCSPARWFCWGTTHFCEPCHNTWQRAQVGPWPECDGKCQFHPHAPNGTKERFGYCTICEAEKAQELGLRPDHH